MLDRDAPEQAVLHHFRTNVRALRLAAGLTLKKAAWLGQMHWRYWRKLEEGSPTVTLETLIRVATVLKVDAATLLAEPAQAAH